MVLTSLIGFSGILLNNRPFLAVYSFLLWICLGLMVSPGYIAYKQRTFNLEGKINLQWSRLLGTDGRLRIQDAVSLFVPHIGSFPDHIPVAMLRIHFTLYRSIDITAMLCPIESARLQIPLPPDRASSTRNLVYYLLFPRTRSDWSHDYRLALLEPYYLPIRKGSYAQTIPT